jgi:hydroxymethylpyrimidine pyrophosphatase-like HAD family hydrolase
VHVSADGGRTWADVPVPRARTSPIGPGFRVVALPPPPLRFVLTDTAGAWDNPSADCDPAFRHGANYAAPEPGAYVLYHGQLTRHACGLRTEGLAIVTDIDGTLHGCGESLAAFRDLWCRSLALSGAYLVYNTGRDIESTAELIRAEAGAMPVPVAAVTRVGGCVHWFRADGGAGEWCDFDAGEGAVEDAAWRRAAAAVPGWDRHCIPHCRGVLDRLMCERAAPGEDPVAKWLCDGVGEDACLQICALVRADAAAWMLETLRRELAHLPVKMIMSGQGSHRYLDVTVASAGKLGGTKYVVGRLPGESGRIEHAVFSGDSGNDIDALEGGLKGIIVGNAQDDLLDAHEARCRRGPGEFDVVVVEQAFARGIISGLVAHGFIE